MAAREGKLIDLQSAHAKGLALSARAHRGKYTRGSLGDLFRKANGSTYSLQTSLHCTHLSYTNIIYML